MTALPLTIEELDRELVSRGGLVKFVELAWKSGVVEASPYVHDRHIDEICVHLEAVSHRKLDRLIINVPPACSKSSIVSVFWPAWHWAEIDGSTKWMHTSFDLSVSGRDAEKCQNLIMSDWFQRRWGPEAVGRWRRPLEGLTLGFRGQRKGKHRKTPAKLIFQTSAKGLRFSTMMRGKALGWHCHIQVCDDPNKPDEIKMGGDQARKALKRTRDLWTGTFASRSADPSFFARVVIMQRLHHDDLAASCLSEKNADGTPVYVHLCLPMEFVPERACKTPFGGDWRTTKGELLAPNRYPAAKVALKKIEMGPRVAACQLQQNPMPEEGTIFAPGWLVKRWTTLPADCIFWQSWDCTFKDHLDSDWVVGQVWARSGANFYLVDQVRRQMGYVGTVAAILAMTEKWPEAFTKLVEDKANGTAVVDFLKDSVPGLILVEPKGGKVARANAVTGLFAAGNILFPEGALFLEGEDGLIEEFERFPLGAHDDQVDACTQLLHHAAIGGGAYLAALERLFSMGQTPQGL